MSEPDQAPERDLREEIQGLREQLQQQAQQPPGRGHYGVTCGEVVAMGLVLSLILPLFAEADESLGIVAFVAFCLGCLWYLSYARKNPHRR